MAGWEKYDWLLRHTRNRQPCGPMHFKRNKLTHTHLHTLHWWQAVMVWWCEWDQLLPLLFNWQIDWFDTAATTTSIPGTMCFNGPHSTIWWTTITVCVWVCVWWVSVCACACVRVCRCGCWCVCVCKGVCVCVCNYFLVGEPHPFLFPLSVVKVGLHLDLWEVTCDTVSLCANTLVPETLGWLLCSRWWGCIRCGIGHVFFFVIEKQFTRRWNDCKLSLSCIYCMCMVWKQQNVPTKEYKWRSERGRGGE